MNLSKFRLASLLIVLTTVGLYACKKKENTNADNSISINVVSTSVPITSDEICHHQEDNVLHFVSGTNPELQLQFKSAQGLAQYKIEIHSNFDCHGHEAPPSIDWNLSKIVDITGKDTTITEVISVPQDAKSGNYHFMIRLVDVLGNEAPFVEFNVIVTNSIDNIAPTISLDLPVSDSIAVLKGETVTFKGLIEDNFNLNAGKLEWSYTAPDGTEGHLEDLEITFPSNDATQITFEKDFVIAPTMQTGTYTFHLHAVDYYNNVGEKEIKINILN